jgi:single-stranded-DNA-specific exonuclease
LEPTGNSNPQPVFYARDLKVVSRKVIGIEKIHLRLTFGKDGLNIDAVAFRQAHWDTCMPEKVEVLFHFELNEYNGRVSFQLNVRDMRPSEK